MTVAELAQKYTALLEAKYKTPPGELLGAVWERLSAEHARGTARSLWSRAAGFAAVDHLRSSDAAGHANRRTRRRGGRMVWAASFGENLDDGDTPPPAAEHRFPDLDPPSLPKTAVRLTPVQRAVANLYYGMAGRPMTMAEVGELVGLSASQVCIEHAAALRALRRVRAKAGAAAAALKSYGRPPTDAGVMAAADCSRGCVKKTRTRLGLKPQRVRSAAGSGRKYQAAVARASAYAAGGWPPCPPAVAALLEHLLASPATRYELAARMGITEQAVATRIRNAKRLGLVEPAKPGTGRYGWHRIPYRLTPVALASRRRWEGETGRVPD